MVLGLFSQCIANLAFGEQWAEHKDEEFQYDIEESELFVYAVVLDREPRSKQSLARRAGCGPCVPVRPSF